MSAVRSGRWRGNQLGRWLLASALVAMTLPGLAATVQDDWQGVERIVAIGDIHGDYDNYIEVLKNAGVINRRGRWSAGKTHVVQVGDIPDRGPDTLRIISHLQKLEKQASKAGGRLHLLIGNHEYMNITGDLRYVHPGEYEAFETRNSKQLRNNYYAYVVKTIEQQREALLNSGGDASHLPVADDDFKRDWYNEHPLGFVEHRLAWQKDGELFEWIAAHNTIIRINNILFLHGGLSAELLPMSITEINERIRAELNREAFEGEPLGTADSGPLWYRGLARGDEAAERPALDSVLAHFDAEMIVLGHTPDLNAITPRFGGQVVIIDTGISAYYGGHLASLLIEGGTATAMHGDHRLALPTNTAEILPYFEALATQMPENPRLEAHIAVLSNPSVESDVDGPDAAARLDHTSQSVD